MMAHPHARTFETRQILLTKGEALEFAAKQLEKMAADTELGKVVLATIGKDGFLSRAPADVREEFTALRETMIEPDLQIAAMRAAAKVIRDLAMEERLVSARVEAGAGIGR